MATFLTTPRMNPALRARVERAVSQRARARHHAAESGLGQAFAGPRRLFSARLLPVVALAMVAGLIAATVVHDRRVLEAERKALLAALEERRAEFPAGHDAFVAATERWITDAAAAGEPGDVVEPSLQAKGALDAWLRRPAVYVHGAATALGGARTLGDAASESIKDAFLLCLLHPPASASEPELLAKVRGVYFGGAKVDDDTANVRRLAEARSGLAVLGSTFEASARAATELGALKKLRKELDAAPLELARKAAAAEVLIVVADASAVPSSPGRKAVVELVDLASKKLLLRLRRRIDGPGSSPAAALYRDQIEGCSLALAVRHCVEE